MKAYLIFCVFFITVACQAQGNFFDDCDMFFKQYVSDNGVHYEKLKNDPTPLFKLISYIDNVDVNGFDDNTLKAFYINTYNLSVIKQIIFNYPIASVMDVDGFFDEKSVMLNGKKLSLNDLENKVIRPKFNDPKLHFALVCGAISCPPIINEAYKPNNVEQLLERQTRRAINDGDFLKVNGNELGLSKIFEWYADDFGKSKRSIVEFINHYRTEFIGADSKINYYEYDWSLNVAKPNSLVGTEKIGILPLPAKQRYYVSALYDKGEFEVNLFNNLFLEKEKSGVEKGDFLNRNTFNTTYVQLLFGVNKRFNVGLDAKFRSVVKNTLNDEGALDVFKFQSNEVDESGSYSRVGFTALGPRLKYVPFKKFGNISIQQTLYFPLGKDLSEGGFGDKGWIDWQGLTLWNQLFYDNPIGDKFSIFAEVDLLLENFTAPIGKDQAGWQFSTPMTIIPSYFPNNSIVIYGLIGSSPQWWVAKDVNNEVRKNTLSYNPYNQYGLGFKYLITKNWQLELLYTEFLNNNPSVARTFNFGIRYIGRK